MKGLQGFIYALLAAIFNGMVGIFSVKIMATGLSPYAIAFYKCLISFLIITSWLIASRQVRTWLNYIKRLWWQLIIAALFGFFVMYFFETTAYKHENVPVVVFMLLGSAVITTFILSSILNRKWLQLRDVISCSVAVLGLALIFGVNMASSGNYLGILFALIAGIGYGTFLTITPKFNIGSGLLVVNSLMLFGMLYLSVPFISEGFVWVTDMNAAYLLIFLALLPSIGGFLCTTKALTLLKSESVQLIELTEPIFSLAFSYLFLNQLITFWQVIGGLLLIGSICANIASAKPKIQEAK